jgi:succinyl-CoA synthetase beta subunit
MYLLEHDAKILLAAAGVPVPAGCLVDSPSGTDAAALPPGPWMVKGQIPAGGRGKAGLVRPAASPEEAAAHVAAMLSATVEGRGVGAARIEQRIAGAHEAYCGLLLDPAQAGVRVILAASGGVDIEALPRERIQSVTVAPDAQALAVGVTDLASRFPRTVRGALADAGARLSRVFLDLEAVLLEVNPLFVLPDGRWIAGDAKLITDDNALARQPALRAVLNERPAAYPDAALKLEHGFDYVVVDPGGEIGLLTTGAGLSMMLIDELRAAGLKPYNFLDIRTGGLRGESARLVSVLQWIAQGPRVKVLLVNIFAGITDLGEFSRLLLDARTQVPALKVPVVARLVGNGLPEARKALAAASVPLYTELDEALAAVRKQHE